jgi:prepilin-type N-terminal cleavage/methylation domain-containing protein
LDPYGFQKAKVESSESDLPRYVLERVTSLSVSYICKILSIAVKAVLFENKKILTNFFDFIRIKGGNKMKMNKKGVTLIELIVVFAIIAIGAVLMVPNLRPWIINYRLRSATRDITSTLRVAQMKAVTNNFNYQVLFDGGAGTYKLQRNTGGGYFDDGATQTLPTGISIVLGNNPVWFSPNSSSNGGTIQLSNTKNTKKITVLPSTGRITIQ